MMADKLGISEADLRRRTPDHRHDAGRGRGPDHGDGQEYDIPPARPEAVVDPTGAGDAFRPGFVMGMSKGLPWPVGRPRGRADRRSTPSSNPGRSSTPTRSSSSSPATRRTTEIPGKSRASSPGHLGRKDDGSFASMTTSRLRTLSKRIYAALPPRIGAGVPPSRARGAGRVAGDRRRPLDRASPGGLSIRDLPLVRARRPDPLVVAGSSARPAGR